MLFWGGRGWGGGWFEECGGEVIVEEGEIGIIFVFN